jgi:hypothetical protein
MDAREGLEIANPGNVVELAAWRLRRDRARDVEMGALPFVLEEPCPGCGAARVATMVWREPERGGPAVPLPRMEPHFECREGRVVYQEITESPVDISAWSRILGRFVAKEAGGRR